MTILHSIILGIVEGITEFLPISSTGHLILANHILGIPETDFVKSFDIFIQLGAILAVIGVYFKQLFTISTLKRLVVGFVPTGVVGLLLYKVIKHYLLGNVWVVVISLAVVGLLLVVLEKFVFQPHTSRESGMRVSEITYRQAFVIGLFQSVAVIPGVSRSGASIIGGLLQGLPRKTVVEFSFLLAIPTMLAASGLDLLKEHSMFSSRDAWTLTIGFLVSFLVAWVTTKWLLKYVQKHTFTGFGVYRIVIAVCYILLFLR